jgi:hypothetical protein
MQTFDFALTQPEVARTLEFKARLEADGKEFFDSDDFRNYGLDLWMVDPVHEIGALFAKLKAKGFITAVGETASEIASNNKRKVDLWRWVGTRFQVWLERERL